MSNYLIKFVVVFSLSWLGHIMLLAWLSYGGLSFIPERKELHTFRVSIKKESASSTVEKGEDLISVIDSNHDRSQSLSELVAKAFRLPEDVPDLPVQFTETIVPDLSIPRQTFVQNPDRPNEIQSEFLYTDNPDAVAKYRTKFNRSSEYIRDGFAALGDFGKKVTAKPEPYIPRPNYQGNLFESRQKKESQGIESGKMTPWLIAQHHIHKFLDRPLNDEKHKEWHGVIGFYLDHYGNVRDLKFKKRSGNKALDDALELAIRRASPLPVPKDEIELRRFIQAPKRFDYNETYLKQI